MKAHNLIPLMAWVGLNTMFGCAMQAPPILEPSANETVIEAEANCDEPPAEEKKPEDKPKLPELVQNKITFSALHRKKKTLTLHH